MLKADDTPITNLTQKDLISLINSKVRIALNKERAKYRLNSGDELSINKFVEAKKTVRCFANESLIIMGNDISMPYRWCMGVGTCTKIIKGNDFDLVYINFGRSYGREIIVRDNHARRQLLTLKRGHLTTFIGKFNIYTDKKGQLRVIFYAIGLQDWYLPIAADFKQLKKDSKTTDFFDSQLSLEEETDYSHFIDDLIKQDKGDKE